MRRVTIDLPDNYDGVLSITAIGGINSENIKITTYVADLEQGTYLVNDGKKWVQKKEKIMSELKNVNKYFNNLSDEEFLEVLKKNGAGEGTKMENIFEELKEKLEDLALDTGCEQQFDKKGYLAHAKIDYGKAMKIIDQMAEELIR